MTKNIFCIFLLWIPIIANAEDRAGIEFFETKIRPVLVKHCYECHSTETGKARGGLKLDTRNAMMRGGDSGPVLAGRSAARSLLYQSITYEGDYQMPPKGKLPDEVIADVRRWIELGSPDPRVTKSVADVTSGINVDAGRNDWAYQIPQQENVPAVVDRAWPISDLDRFVLGRIESEDLHPVADATPQTLVRRLFFVLTGLPPTPAAVKRWTRQLDSGDGGINQVGVANLIDGLLRTKYYGESWARHWLDVARFAESTGGDSNNVFQHAWRYRDYVIDAFNNDKPFDRFIQEQIAGDLLPISDDDDWANNLIATGFLAVGQKLVGEEDSQKFFADVVDEQIDSTTRAFLATTVACARCHDHKFDPIPQSDYYALAGIFRATETHFGLIKAQARQATTLIDITDLGVDPGTPSLTASEYAELVEDRNQARSTVDDAMRKIRNGENVFRGTLRRIRSDRDETEAALQAYDSRGNPRAFAMGTQDRDFPLPTRLLLRGEIDKPAQLIPRGFVQVLSKPGRHSLSSRTRGSGRLELAAWIASEQNPLTARVIVNRVWYWMFGQGIVRTVDDFGSSGEAPSHPELLDHLATSFVQNGWSIKSLIRRIAMSRTWQLSSEYDPANFDIDPDNRMLWRMSERRLEGEAIRDAMLSASGDLNPERPVGTLLRSVGEGTVGQNVFEPVIRAMESNHRSVYLPRVRNVMPELLELFDAPDAGSVSGTRDSTSSPLQALFMLNNDFVAKQASGIAGRLVEHSDSEQVDLAYLLLLGRQPTEDERNATSLFLQTVGRSSGFSRSQMLAAFCQVLMCTAEFSQID